MLQEEYIYRYLVMLRYVWLGKGDIEHCLENKGRVPGGRVV